MPPHQLRLLAAVHEAGHAITAHTLKMTVTSATVTSLETIGDGDDCITIDFSAYPHRIVPAPAILAMKVAGFQASHIWLEGRRINGSASPYWDALNTLAGGDLHWCTRFSADRGLPPMQQHALPGAHAILFHRWRDVLTLAYALARQGRMDASDLQPLLDAGPERQAKAHRAYVKWRRDEEFEQHLRHRGAP